MVWLGKVKFKQVRFDWVWLEHGKNGFVTATKLGTTNKFFVAATKNFATQRPTTCVLCCKNFATQQQNAPNVL